MATTAAGYPQQKINSKTYFESGRLSRLPLGTCYLSADLRIDNCMVVIITRKHVNQKVSFGLFGLDPETGQLMHSNFEHNMEETNLLDTMEEYGLVQFEDVISLQQLVHGAVVASLKSVLPLPPEFRFAKCILDEPLDEQDKSAPVWKKLAKFQVTPNRKETTTRRTDSEAAFLRRVLYLPADVASWTREDWKQYLLKIKATKEADRGSFGITPLVYIHEHTLLEAEPPLSRPVAVALERFASLSTAIIDGDSYPTFGYQASDSEDLHLKTMQTELSGATKATRIDHLIREVNGYISNFPDNPGFAHLRFDCYLKKQGKHKPSEIARKNYRRFPRDVRSIVNYMGILNTEYKFDEVVKLLDDQFLLEDRFPERSYFLSVEFTGYYLALFTFFMHSGDYRAAWELHRALQNHPRYIDLHGEEYNRFNLVYWTAAMHMTSSIDPLLESDADIESLIDKLMPAS